MFTRSLAADVKPRQSNSHSQESVSVQPKQKPILVNFALLALFIFLCLMMLDLGVVIVARMTTTPQILELPQSYLPGNPLPKETSCYTEEHLPRCFVHLFGKDIYFNYDTHTRMITRTIIPAQEYTLGQLIAAWGEPSGIVWSEFTIYVYWGKRSTLLYTKSIQPDSRVDFILYNLEESPTSPWRGFTCCKH